MIYHGDCLEKLKKLKADSIDSLITDPPAGISFMNKSWDSDKGGRDEWILWMTEVMRECNRVLKPGAHALVWSIPRTSHWTTTAIENAGFEIRDVVTHLFGSGFPKSLDISKAIDKEAGAKRLDLGINPNRIGRTQDIRGNGLGHGSGNAKINAEELTRLTAPSTDDAKKWQGFGTALKPAAEFWVLARKPLSEKTVAKNVLKHGTGGLNIDASRIEATDQAVLTAMQLRLTGKAAEGWKNTSVNGVQPNMTQGRFPANLVLSGSAIEELDEQSGVSKSPKTYQRKSDGLNANSYGNGMGEKSGKESLNFGDSGGASRFFYCAKVSPSERGENNNHPTVKAQKLMQYLIKLITPPGGIVLDPFMGSGSTGIACKQLGFKFIGIEKESQYVEIAEKRMEAVIA